MTTYATLGGVTVNVRGIEDELWRKFRALCEYEGKSTGEKLNELLREAVGHLNLGAVAVRDPDESGE